MFENLIIRDAEKNDLPAIVDIYNSTIASRMVTADTEPITVQSWEPWFRGHNPASRPLWVVLDQKKICGWISFQSFYGRPAYHATAEISIYIHQDFRGKKLGQYLMQKAIDACPQLEIKTLLGFIFAHNEPSLKLFYRLGFAKWAHLPNIAELDGIERDLIILGKRVTP